MIKSLTDTAEACPSLLESRIFRQLDDGMKKLQLPHGSHPVVMACDDSYAMPLATAFRSMAETNRSGRCLDIVVLTSQFSPQIKQKVLNSLPSDSAIVHWVPVDLALFQQFSTRDYISKMTYARLLLPYFFSDSVSRILYLDADLLVVDDLAPLWDMDLEGACLAAVVDTDAQAHGERLEANRKHIMPGPDPESRMCEYFNAGVLLIDLPSWRNKQISERALQHMIANPHSLLADQDALNVACEGRWKQLDARWNLQNHPPVGYLKIRPEQRPAIIHFAGKWKPWNPVSLSADASFYDAFRNRTEFARTLRDRARDATQRGCARLKRFLRRYKVAHVIYRHVTG
jgi:lipopolysaccharide biosynthesis glycosyltransferase